MHQWIICVQNGLFAARSATRIYHVSLYCLCVEQISSKTLGAVVKLAAKSWTGDTNLLNQTLVERKTFIFPTLYIKLGIMKDFVKALSIQGDFFKYIISVFPNLSYVKIKAGVFDGSQIRQLIKDKRFIERMTELWKHAWLVFEDIVKNFLANIRAQTTLKLFNNSWTALENLVPELRQYVKTRWHFHLKFPRLSLIYSPCIFLFIDFLCIYFL